MQEYMQFYINGEWVDPVTPSSLEVINPATEQPFATISMGSAADVEKAVAAASGAFDSFSTTTVAERVELLGSILAEYTKRYDEIAAAISTEMGAPLGCLKQLKQRRAKRTLQRPSKCSRPSNGKSARVNTCYVANPLAFAV